MKVVMMGASTDLGRCMDVDDPEKIVGTMSRCGFSTTLLMLSAIPRLRRQLL